MTKNIPLPPFTEETALLQVQSAEELWNMRDPDKIILTYAEDSEYRNRGVLLKGRAEIKAALLRKWAKELDYRLKKYLWGFRNNRIAAHFEYEWHDNSSHWFRSYGVELWDFDAEGLLHRHIASINDVSITASDRHISI